MQLTDNKFGVNCERNVENLFFVSARRLFLTNKTIFIDISFTIHPHLPDAGAKQ
jgi:hypothetical protein